MNIRHGDIGLIPTDSITKDFKPRKDNVLAWGEVTNHSHRILPKTINDTVEIYENEKGELAIKVNGVGVLVHEEHKTIEVPSGTYKINREREFNYFEMSTQRVQD